MAVDPLHIGIQMKRKEELTKTFMMISIWKNPLVSTNKISFGFQGLRAKLRLLIGNLSPLNQFQW